MPRMTAAWGAAPVLIVVALGVAAAIMLSQDGAPDTSYEALSRGLQTDIPALAPEQSWRDSDQARADSPQWVQPLIALGRLILDGTGWVLGGLFRFIASWPGAVTLGVLVLAGLGYLVFKFGRVSRSAAPAADDGRSGYAPAAAHEAFAERLSFDAILALDDMPRALGELLKISLDAAASLTGLSLSRSDTAREALRRLPAEFEFLAALKDLAAESERVRFAGAAISRDRFEALAEAIRPLIAGADQTGEARS